MISDLLLDKIFNILNNYNVQLEIIETDADKEMGGYEYDTINIYENNALLGYITIDRNEISHDIYFWNKYGDPILNRSLYNLTDSAIITFIERCLLRNDIEKTIWLS